MTAARKTKRQLRDLIEQAGIAAPTGPKLKLDEANGIIFRVKVLGRFSRNNHGLLEAENGTEYSLGCMKRALDDYEGKKVKCDHPEDRAQPAKERPVAVTLGVLRNCVIESDESGEPAIWADLHCLTSHPMYPRVIEDVKKGLGVYGLSHNAAAARERFDRGSKRLVIEELSTVRSVDLVDKPATNRTLWESERPTMKTTLRELLESRRAKWSKPRRKWADVLLEDDAMAPQLDAPMDAPEDGGDADDALWTGFKQAIDKLFDQYVAGEMDEKAVGKTVVECLKAHKKLTSHTEPEPPAEDASESDADGEDDADKCANDKKLNAERSESERELATLKAREKARELCESIDFAPTALQVKAIAALADPKEQRQLAESFKGGTASRTPRSSAPGTFDRTGKGDKSKSQRNTLESDNSDPKAAATRDLNLLRE